MPSGIRPAFGRYPVLSLATTNTALFVALLGLVVLYRLPKFGQAVLAFLRDLRDFRDGR